VKVLATNQAQITNWPAQQPIALSVNVMYEAWADDSAPGVGPMGNPIRSGYLDLQARSWAAYGVEVGIKRLLDILAREDIQATIYTSGLLAERQPTLLKAMVEQGHNVAAHGWTQDVLPIYLSREEESAALDRSGQAILSATNIAPRGYVSPRCTPSAVTSTLLAERGYLWHIDTFDRDLPAVEVTEGGPMVAVPFTMELNDLPLAVRYGNEPQAFTRSFERLIDRWDIARVGPACLDLTVHAHVFGRPAGAIEFQAALALATRSDLVWLTSHHELAAGTLATYAALEKGKDR